MTADFTIAPKGYTAPQSRKFWGFVPIGRPDECWLWSGYRNRGGYPVLDGRVATRIMREQIDGRAVPADRLVCHACDNPPCVNPNHLWIGTHSANALDMVAKGRKPIPAPSARCRRGHEFTPENTIIERGEVRRCRICRARRNRRAK
jgi:hypothetical protein